MPAKTHYKAYGQPRTVPLCKYSLKMSAWGCKTYNFDVASSSAGWVFASVVEVTGVWVSECFLGQLQPRQNVAKVVLFIGYICIYIYNIKKNFSSPDRNGDSSDTQPIHCLQCLYSYGLYTDRCWLVKTSNTPTKWEEMWPKKHVTKNLQASVKQNKTKHKQGRKWQKCSCCGSIWHLLTLLRFLKK